MIIPVTYDFKTFKITFAENSIRFSINDSYIYLPTCKCEIENIDVLDSEPLCIKVVYYGKQGGLISFTAYSKTEVFEVANYIYQMFFAKLIHA